MTAAAPVWRSPGRVAARTSVTVESTTTDQIHIEVEPRDGAGGLGLRLVDQISTDWGVRNQNGRTIVWADGWTSHVK